MTQSGEQLTLKGENKLQHTNLYSFHKSLGISYGIDLEDRNRVRIKMYDSEKNSAELFQMIFVIRGQISFSNSGSQTDHHRIESQQHNLCRTATGRSQMSLNPPADEVICINLSEDFLNRYLPPNHPAWQQLRLNPENSATLSENHMRITPEISAILQRLDQTSNNGFCDQLLLESKVIELLALQISQFEALQTTEQPISLKKEEMDKMLEARKILITHNGEQLSLRSLAHLVGTNEFNLKRNFKIAFGTTVYGYLNQYKMEQAKTMLIEKDLTISEVSSKMGYKYATHFSNAFKKYFGYLPNKLKSGKLSLLFFVEDIGVLYEHLGLLTHI